MSEQEKKIKKLQAEIDRLKSQLKLSEQIAGQYLGALIRVS